MMKDKFLSSNKFAAPVCHYEDNTMALLFIYQEYGGDELANIMIPVCFVYDF